MSWPAHDAPTRCDRCGRRHGYEGCASVRAAPYTTGPHATYASGPHTSGSTPRVPPQAHPGHGAGPAWPTGQHRAYAPTLHSGPQPTYRPPATGQQPAAQWPPPSGPQPVYRPPVTGSQPVYRPPTGSQPAYRPPTGQQPAYRPPVTGSQPALRPTGRPGDFGQPSYPVSHYGTRTGRPPAVPAAFPQPGPSSPLDWTGQLGDWSQGVAARTPLDLTGRADGPGLWADRRDDHFGPAPAPAPAPVSPAGPAGPGPATAPVQQVRTDHLWPSVTTDPFGVTAQAAAVRAEQRERSRTASFGFQLHMHTPRRARRHTVEFATHWGLDDLVEAAELVVSELMTNALEASLPGLDRQGVSMAVAPLELRLSAEGRSLRIEIRDHNPDPPVLVEDPDVDDERGRGLLLVDCYCEVWGYHRLPTGGKVVWCLIGPPDA